MHPAGLPCRTLPRTARALWAWALVLAVLLKAAVPGLAAAAAQLRGVALADVCSVYGVRTLPADPATPTAPATHAGQHLGCALAPLLGAAPLPVLPPGLTPALRAACLAPPTRLRHTPPLHDASHRWLTLHLHAPPALA
ncbi:MAG TPA: hypothetical protein VGE36_16515 [Roseateles sp.]